MKIVINGLVMTMLLMLFVFALDQWARTDEPEFFEAEILYEQEENQIQSHRT